MSSPFLQNFIKMRAEIRKSHDVAVVKPISGTALSAPTVSTSEMTFRKIVSDKPPVKDVCEYFRKFIKELENASDSD
jgi:hypothetical protein